MNREELKKEAQEQVNYCTPLYPESFIQGYLAGAEPRENKIADIKANCDLAIEGRDIKIKELEKKNAELKEHHKSVCETLTNTHRSLREQLTKTKDLLKKMYYLYFDPCVTHKDLENRDKLFEEVKQFIKE